MAASMLRGAVASALRRRSPLWRGVVPGAPSPFHSRVLRTGAASALRLPPPAASAAFRHLLSSTANGGGAGVTESERRKAVDEAKAEVLRDMMRDDGGVSSSKMEKLVGFLRRQIPHDDPPASAAGSRDKHLMLTLLVRSARAEEKLNEETRRVEQLDEKMDFTVVRVFALFLTVFVGLPVLGLVCLIAKLFWRVLLAVFAPDRTKATK